jgi:hypothetical protein
MSTCPTFWIEDPSILWKEAQDFYPFSEDAKKCSTTALNSLTRFGVYLAIVLTLLCREPKYLFVSIAFAGIAIAAYYGMKQRGVIREGFGEPTDLLPFSMPGSPAALIAGIAVADQPIQDVIGDDNRTLPTAANPFMNVLLTEIGDTPGRGAALTGDTLSRQWSDSFQTKMYGDPGDVFQHNQSQRIWTPQPSTTIPNDQHSFQNWLYRIPGQTCKEGNNRACTTSGSDGATIPWLSSPY